MARLVKTGLITLALGLVMLGLAVPSMAGPTVVLLQVNQAEVAWADPDLSGKLERRLTTEVGLEVKSVIFHKYETVGVIEGEVRFYDVARSRLLISRPIDFELEAKRVFQGSLDGDKNDPSIHLSAVEKLSFFDKMEEKLAEQLVDRIKKVMKKS